MQFFVPDGVDRIEFEGGYWVDIKKMLAYGDVERLSAARLTGLDPAIDPALQQQAMEQIVAGLDQEKTAVPLLVASIFAWNLPGPDGKVPPVDEASVRRLNPVVAAKLLAEVLARNPLFG